MKRNALAIGAVLVTIASVVLLLNYRQNQAETQDFPDGTFWLCQECGHGFSKTLTEVAEFAQSNPGEKFPCPQCGKAATMRASRCPLPSCGKYYTGQPLVIDGKPSCPVCKQPLP